MLPTVVNIKVEILYLKLGWWWVTSKILLQICGPRLTSTSSATSATLHWRRQSSTTITTLPNFSSSPEPTSTRGNAASKHPWSWPPKTPASVWSGSCWFTELTWTQRRISGTRPSRSRAPWKTSTSSGFWSRLAPTWTQRCTTTWRCSCRWHRSATPSSSRCSSTLKLTSIWSISLERQPSWLPYKKVIRPWS